MKKALPFGIIRVETLRLETLFDNVPVHQDPFHFGRTGVDDEPHKQIIFCKNKENCDKPNVFYRFAAHLSVISPQGFDECKAFVGPSTSSGTLTF